jgi:hypothetical protein
MKQQKRRHRRVNILQPLTQALAATAGSALLSGCARAPSFSILGSFFPAWLVCIIVGIVLAAVANGVLTRNKLDKLIVWPVVVYPSLAAFFAFTLWLVFFS